MGTDDDSRSGDEHEKGNHPTDEEQVETEWHFWLLAILATGGIALIIFPLEMVPSIGFILVALAVVGWLAKTFVEKGM